MNEFLIFIFIICVGVMAIGTYDIMRTKKTDIKIVTPIDEKDISEMTYEEKLELGFGEKGSLKEMLGHRAIEVLGGIIVGAVIGLAGFLIFK